MEDKTFELMEKMYIEFNKKFDKIDQRFDKIDQRFDSMESDVGGVKKDILRLENDLKPKVEAALYGYKVVYEKLQELQTEVREVSKKVET